MKTKGSKTETVNGKASEPPEMTIKGKLQKGKKARARKRPMPEPMSDAAFGVR